MPRHQQLAYRKRVILDYFLKGQLRGYLSSGSFCLLQLNGSLDVRHNCVPVYFKLAGQKVEGQRCVAYPRFNKAP